MLPKVAQYDALTWQAVQCPGVPRAYALPVIAVKHVWIELPMTSRHVRDWQQHELPVLILSAENTEKCKYLKSFLLL